MKPLKKGKNGSNAWQAHRHQLSLVCGVFLSIKPLLCLRVHGGIPISRPPKKNEHLLFSCGLHMLITWPVFMFSWQISFHINLAFVFIQYYWPEQPALWACSSEPPPQTGESQSWNIFWYNRAEVFFGVIHWRVGDRGVRCIVCTMFCNFLKHC